MKVINTATHHLSMVKPQNFFLILLVILATSYTMVIGHWAVSRFMSFEATIWDLGLMTQAIWNTAHGRILHESVNLGFSISRLTVAHWELIYLPLALIFRIFPSIPLLLLLQTAILACGSFPIYKYAVKKLSSPGIALGIAISYLFYPALHGSNLFDLHGLTFSTTFLLFTFYYLDQGDQIKTLIFAVLSICCREDVAFIIVTMGLYAWMTRKQNKISIILLTLGMVWIILFFTRGYFNNHLELIKPPNVAANWAFPGGNWINEYLTFPSNLSLAINQSLFISTRLRYIIKLTLPVLGVCFLSPQILLLSLPTLLLNLMSNSHQMHQVEYHYTATITPFVFLAAIQGLANLKSWLARSIQIGIERFIFLMAIFIAIASVISTTQFSIVRFHKTWRVSEADRLLSKKLQEIPAELSVSTTARLGAHLAKRKELYHFPDHLSDAKIILLELNRPVVEINHLSNNSRTSKIVAMNELTQPVFQDTMLGIRFVQNNVFCFQRGINFRESYARYAFMDQIPSSGIHVERIDLGNGLFFRGWETVYIGATQAHFKLFWEKREETMEAANLNFYLKTGERIIPISHQPLFGVINIQQWPRGKIINDHLFIDRPEIGNDNTISVIANFSSDQGQAKASLFSFKFLPESQRPAKGS